MGLVYLILNVESGRYKIGITKNSANKRISNLKTGNDCELMLIKTYESRNYKAIERLLHVYYEPKRICGEWFELEDSDVFNFKNKCNEMDETINVMKDNPYFK